MISLKVNNVNDFMNSLLGKDTFDSFLVSELEIINANTFHIDGRLNKSFYTDEELAQISEDFVNWSKLRPICFDIIKGKKVPSKVKIVFQLSKSSIASFVGQSGLDIDVSTVSGMYMHVLFENNTVHIITGTSLSIFTMDKSLDKCWDEQIKRILAREFDIEIE